MGGSYNAFTMLTNADSNRLGINIIKCKRRNLVPIILTYLRRQVKYDSQLYSYISYGPWGGQAPLAPSLNGLNPPLATAFDLQNFTSIDNQYRLLALISKHYRQYIITNRMIGVRRLPPNQSVMLLKSSGLVLKTQGLTQITSILCNKTHFNRLKTSRFNHGPSSKTVDSTVNFFSYGFILISTSTLIYLQRSSVVLYKHTTF
ncbi:hypothetical protein AGLY_000876 [Aphis glycines]|uniref:Uncharacterized protein n=1 Tax=Aphis glycines TaxID=307491 RepID=A0A6G0U8Q8_APHGL|nr:hypothetical protein AGLY_000876 [Aphis glycines]